MPAVGHCTGRPGAGVPAAGRPLYAHGCDDDAHPDDLVVVMEDLTETQECSAGPDRVRTLPCEVAPEGLHVECRCKRLPSRLANLAAHLCPEGTA